MVRPLNEQSLLDALCGFHVPTLHRVAEFFGYTPHELAFRDVLQRAQDRGLVERTEPGDVGMLVLTEKGQKRTPEW